MTGIQELLANSNGYLSQQQQQRVPHSQYPHEHHKHVSMAPRRHHPPTLPSLSVLMQPRAVSAYNSNDSSSNSTTGASTASLPVLHIPQYQNQQQQRHAVAYTTPQYDPTQSPTAMRSWSPCSTTSSTNSASATAFPMHQQTFHAAYSHLPAPVSPSYDSYEPIASYQQQQHQQRPPCTCGCDPMLSDDEAVLLAVSQSSRRVSIHHHHQQEQEPTLQPINQDAPTASPSAANEPTPLSPPPTTSGKTSRYLREMDRRAILARLDNGEKQSVLAKEYHVSRSSICNLFKHRDEVLSRVHQHPLTKHPKKPRTAVIVKHVDVQTGVCNNHHHFASCATKTTQKLLTCVKTMYPPFASSACKERHNFITSHVETDMMVDATGRVHRVGSRASIVLLSLLDKPQLTERAFQQCAKQLLLLLLDEALTLLPTFAAPASASHAANRWQRDPLCAITLEQANQHAILDVFHSLAPHCARGYVQWERSQWHQDVQIRFLETAAATRLPTTLQHHSVLLLDVAVTSPPTVAIVLERLLRHGAREDQITLVAVFVAQSVVACVQRQFPNIHIIAADIESSSCSSAMAPPRSVLFKHRLEHMYATSSSSMDLQL